MLKPLLAQLVCLALASTAIGQVRPNILWITSEDNGPELGCYGDAYAGTPNIDALAARGMMYLNCWSNAPVCAPSRTAILTGMYPTSLGAQHMRSQVRLPPEVKPYPQLLHGLGYYCTNNSKEDYNLFTAADLWSESSATAHWRNRASADQPFFAVFNFMTSHESQIRLRPHEAVHDPSKVQVPPYHPDTPEVRQDWAQYYDKISEMDAQVGQVLDELKADGLEDSTIVFYYGDHGSGMPRSKRWLYQSGLRVPLIVYVPEALKSLAGSTYQPGTKSKRLVGFVDLLPTLLSLAGEQVDPVYQGRAFLGRFATDDPEYIYGFRDRMGERYDMSRAVRDERLLYIRNFHPHRPQGAYVDYMFQTPTTSVWRNLFDAGRLTPAQARFWQPKDSEELYDLERDPHQIDNRAGDPARAQDLERLRDATKKWMLDVRDVGLLPEGEMLERAGTDAPCTFAHDATRFAVEALYDAADLATRPRANDLWTLMQQRDSRDSAVRFWVANGILIRAERNLERGEAVIFAALMSSDPSPYVRCVTHEVRARFGQKDNRQASIDALIALADMRQTNAFVAMTALNSLDACNPSRAELGNRLEGLPEKDPSLSSRYDGYVPSLVKRIESSAK